MPKATQGDTTGQIIAQWVSYEIDFSKSSLLTQILTMPTVTFPPDYSVMQPISVRLIVLHCKCSLLFPIAATWDRGTEKPSGQPDEQKQGGSSLGSPFLL